MSYLAIQEDSMGRSIQHHPRISNCALRSCYFSRNDHYPCQILQHLQYRRRVAYKPKTLPNIPPPHNFPHHINHRHFQPRRALLQQFFSRKSGNYGLQDALRFTHLPGYRVCDRRERFRRHLRGGVTAGSFRLDMW
jgi:hypothetical protein